MQNINFINNNNNNVDGEKKSGRRKISWMDNFKKKDYRSSESSRFIRNIKRSGLISKGNNRIHVGWLWWYEKMNQQLVDEVCSKSVGVVHQHTEWCLSEI